MKLFQVFNPEHDLALSNGDRYFIAPRNIREMACDLAPLLEVIKCNHPIVWGWDSAVAEQLFRRGIAREALPTDVALSALRERSGRQTAHHLLRAFRSENPNGPYIGESVLIHHAEEIDPYVACHKHIMLKNPLSGSGKGLRHLSCDCVQSKTIEWANALILRHGYLTAEPYYNKVLDFAMEFHVTEGKCRFFGYSLFTTNHHGRYEANILMEDKKIETILSNYIPCVALHALQTWVIHHTDLIVPTEWDTNQFPLHFGIDMMIVKDAGSDKPFALHPCVEINLRLNMGIIAHEVRRHFLAPETEGTFHIASFPTTEALQTFHHSYTQKFPAVYHDRKIESGYHPVTPVLSHTRYLAYVLCRHATQDFSIAESTL